MCKISRNGDTLGPVELGDQGDQGGYQGHQGTVGENRDFWLLKTSLIFKGVSWDLDVNVLKHITMKILLQIKRYFKFVL